METVGNRCHEKIYRCIDSSNIQPTRVNIAAKLSLTLALLFSLASVAAMTIDFEPIVGTITGTDFVVTPVTIDGLTLTRATLIDFEDPASFQQLAFGWFNESDGTPIIGGNLDAAGVLDLTLDPGNYLAVVGGIAGGDLNIGTFGLEISDLPVPAAGWLLLVSICALHRIARAR